MSLASVKAGTEQCLNAIYDALEEQGVDISSQPKNLVNVAPAIESIEGGGDVTVYTVTFDSNGGTEVAEQIIVSGQTAKEPETTRDGYKVRYWALNNVEYDFNTPVIENITLVAVWKEILVPEGCTELEYIESTGTQWIDTGVAPKLNYKVEIGFQLTRIETTDESWIYAIWETQGFRCGLVGAGGSNAGFETSRGFSYSQTTNRNMYTVGTGINTIRNFTGNPYLFAQQESGSAKYVNNSKFRLYYCKIWDSSNKLLRNYVPTLNTNNLACLYDTVSKTFFYNQGSGSFTAGPVVA